LPQLCAALVLFGVGESMSMTPVMDDMMASCGEHADASVDSLSSPAPDWNFPFTLLDAFP